MKKIQTTFVILICTILSSYAQITFDGAITVANPSLSRVLSLIKFNSLGYKYVLEDISQKTLKIYDLNLNLYTTINIPAVATGSAYSVTYISDNLFDLNNDIEYVVTKHMSGGNISKVFVFKDNGTQIFYRDSAALSGNGVSDAFYNYNGIFFNGTSAKMKIARISSTVTASKPVKWELYTLPGVLPCIQCSATGTVLGKSELSGNSLSEATFYPNPVTDQLKLKYTLPKDFKTAEIKIQDLQGKQLDSFKVTSDFEFIYLPSNYNNGLYLYSLIVDGQLIKTEKIILDK